MSRHQPLRALLPALLALATLLALAAGPALAAEPLPIPRDEAPGLVPAKGASASARAGIAVLLPRRAKPLARRGALAATAYRGGGRRLVTGVLLPGSEAKAAALAARARRFRSTVGKTRSEAVALVRVRDAVLVVRVTAARRDAGVRAAARTWLALLAKRVGRLRPAGQLERVLLRVEPGGAVPLPVALAGFEAVYGDLPGVPAPPGARTPAADGTMQLRWLLQHWPELTSAQQTAAQAALGMQVGSAVPLGAAARAPRLAPRVALTPSPQFQALADSFVPIYQANLGGTPDVVLPWPVRVYTTPTPLGRSASADAAPVDASGRIASGAGIVECQIRIAPYTQHASAAYQRFVVAHEVFHCFQFRISAAWASTDDWIIEGSADWAASQVASTREAASWYDLRWRSSPGTALFGRTYDASGFWGLAHERGGNLWPRIADIIRQVSNDGAYASANGDGLIGTWASGIVGEAGAWNQTSPWAAADRRSAAYIVPASGGTLQIGAYGARVFRISAPAGRPLLFPHTESGFLRAGAPGDLGDADGAVYCVGGGCVCPPGQQLTLSGIRDVPAHPLLALAGGTAAGRATLDFRRVRDFCRPEDERPGGPAGPGASSNGDPHLQTLDGLRYDFQGAGEFVLVRSTSGDLEVQARQQASPGFGGVASTRATVNTMLGFRVHGHRVTVARSAAAPIVRVDGVVRIGAAGAQRDLGAGASVRRLFGDQVEVVWPDGSTAQVAGVGRWGVAVFLRLVGARRGHVRGLLGNFDADATNDLATRGGARIAFTPERYTSAFGTLYEVRDPWRRPFFDALYDRVGESWRITKSTSVLDYAAGQSPATFTDRSLPERPLDYEKIDAERRAAALAACKAAGVTGELALRDCVEDVFATGNTEFARLAAEAEEAASTRWAALDAGAALVGPEDAVRAPDGSLVLLLAERVGPSDRRLASVRIAADGTESPEAAVLDGDGDASLAPGPGGRLEAFVGGIRSAATPGSGIYRVLADAPYTSWAETDAVTSYGSSYLAKAEAVVLDDGTPIVASGMAGAGRTFRGGRPLTDPGALLDPDPDCYATSPNLIRAGDGALWAAWARWDCAAPLGTTLARVDPATGAIDGSSRVTAPGAGWLLAGSPTTWLPSLDASVTVALGPGGRPVVAYPAYDPDANRTSIRLFAPGLAATTVATVRGGPPSTILVGGDGTGRVWVAWNDGLRLKVARTRVGSLAVDGTPAILGRPAEAADGAGWWSLVADRHGADVLFWRSQSGDVPGGIWRAVLA